MSSLLLSVPQFTSVPCLVHMWQTLWLFSLTKCKLIILFATYITYIIRIMRRMGLWSCPLRIAFSSCLVKKLQVSTVCLCHKKRNGILSVSVESMWWSSYSLCSPMNPIQIIVLMSSTRGSLLLYSSSLLESSSSSTRQFLLDVNINLFYPLSPHRLWKDLDVLQLWLQRRLPDCDIWRNRNQKDFPWQLPQGESSIHVCQEWLDWPLKGWWFIREKTLHLLVTVSCWHACLCFIEH